MPRQEIGNATPVNADFTNRPLYGGEMFMASSAGMGGGFSPIRTQSAHIPVNPLLEQVMRGAGIQNEAMAELGQALAERHDFALSLTRKAEAAQLSAAMNQEFAQRASVQDGAPGSFYTADHALNADVVRDFQNKYLRLSDTSASGFLLPENKMRATEAKSTAQQGIRMAVNTNILGLQKQRAITAFSNDYYALLAAGRFDDAMKALAMGEQMNVITPQDTARLTNAARKSYSKHRAASAVSSGGKPAVDMDDAFFDQFSE